MKTLITTLAIIVLSVTTLPAKDGTFTSVVLHDSDHRSESAFLLGNG